MKDNGFGQEARLLQALVNCASVRRPGPELWHSGLDTRGRYAAGSVYFLLGSYKAAGQVQDPGGDGFAATRLEHFISRILPRLVRQLSRRTERRQVMYRGQARGPIQWPATFKARYSGDGDETCLVCRQVERLYDTPENQLLKHTVEGLSACLEQIPDAIQTGKCLVSVEGQAYFEETRDRLTVIESGLRQLRKNPFLRQVSSPERIDDYHLLRAESARLVEYAKVAEVYRAYRGAVIEGRWNKISDIGRQIMPLPLDPDQNDLWLNLGAAVLRS